MTDNSKAPVDRRAGAEPARRLEALRSGLGPDGHRARRACRRSGRPGGRQRRREIDAGEGSSRCPSTQHRHDHLRRQAGHAARSGRGARSRHRHGIPGPRAVRKPRCRRQHLPWARAESAVSPRRGRDGGAGLDASERIVGPHSERARRGRLAVGRAAPDRGDRTLAAAGPEADHARRADGGAGRGPDRRGAEPDRAGARPRPRGDHDQPQHGGRPRRGGPDRGAAARPQQRHFLSRLLE